MRRLLLILLMAGSVTVARAATEPPSPDAATAACLERLRTLLEQVDALETAAKTAEQSERVECLRAQRAKLAVLQEIVRTARIQWQSFLDEGDQPSAAAELAKITAACERTDAIPAAIAACTQNPKPELDKPVAHPGKSRPLSRTVASGRQPSAAAAAPLSSCLRQPQLACLLARAMELVTEDNPEPSLCIKVLHDRKIEPLGGWQPEQCVTLDDLSVALARALKLEKPDDPNRAAGCLQALRDAGLPVDTLLPPRLATEPPPLVSERQVRALLTGGGLAPLPLLRPAAPARAADR